MAALLRRTSASPPDRRLLTEAVTRRAPVKLAPEVQRRLIELLMQGKKIDAVCHVQDQTGWGLKNSKHHVEWCLGNSPTLPKASGAPDEASGAEPGSDVRSEVEELLARGERIEAIKLLRERTGLSLREAKEYVDALPVEDGSAGDDLKPRDVSSG